jgi:hypothetical protein
MSDGPDLSASARDEYDRIAETYERISEDNSRTRCSSDR